jgi:xylose isomerase
VTLTRKFLQSIEEVETISKILNKKYDFFQRLKADCEIFEEQDKENNVAPNNLDGKTSVERASWAVDMIREQLNESSFVLKELTRSMNVVSNQSYTATSILRLAIYRSDGIQAHSYSLFTSAL